MTKKDKFLVDLKPGERVRVSYPTGYIMTYERLPGEYGYGGGEWKGHAKMRQIIPKDKLNSKDTPVNTRGADIVKISSTTKESKIKRTTQSKLRSLIERIIREELTNIKI